MMFLEMIQMINVIVAGVLTARAEYGVLLLERSESPSSPSHTLSTRYIHQTGDAIMARRDLSEQVAASVYSPENKAAHVAGDAHLKNRDQGPDSYRSGYTPRHASRQIEGCDLMVERHRAGHTPQHASRQTV